MYTGKYVDRYTGITCMFTCVPVFLCTSFGRYVLFGRYQAPVKNEALLHPVLFLNFGHILSQRIQNLMEVTRRFRQPFDSVPEFVRADVFCQAITNAIACALQQLCRRLDSDNGSQQLAP